MATANPFSKARTSAPATKTETKPEPKKAEPDFDTAASTKPEPAKTRATKSGGDPFDMPSGPGSGEKITDFMGELLLVKPLELLEGITTSIGIADAIRADVVILSGDRQGDLVDGVLVFQTALRRDLGRILDGPSPFLLGRLGKGAAKAGKSAPFIFEQPEDEDKDLARQYLASLDED